MYVPHERWDKGCSPLLSAGGETNMSQGDKELLLVIVSAFFFEKNNNDHKHCYNTSTIQFYIFHGDFPHASDRGHIEQPYWQISCVTR